MIPERWAFAAISTSPSVAVVAQSELKYADRALLNSALCLVKLTVALPCFEIFPRDRLYGASEVVQLWLLERPASSHTWGNAEIRRSEDQELWPRHQHYAHNDQYSADDELAGDDFDPAEK